MAAEPRRELVMPLRELVTRYLSAAMEFGMPVALSTFALSPEETERVFSAYDEDYQISRFLHFSHSVGTPYQINGQPTTHVAIDSEIASLL